jgi:hypothetical protein
MSTTDPGIVWRPRSFLADPGSNYAQILRAYWWLANDEGDVAFYQDFAGHLYPQANRDKRVGEKFIGRTEDATQLILVPMALVPVDPGDF